MPEWRAGQALEELSLVVDDGVVQRYGDAARDHNPIHFDDTAARRLGLPGRIAHGMITGALLSRMLSRALGPGWLSRGSLHLRFVRPLPVGARVTAAGTVRSVAPLVVDLRATTDDGATVIVGEAVLREPPAT